MRVLVLVGLLVSRVALADDAGDVEKIVRQHLAGDSKVLAGNASIVVHGEPSQGFWLRELLGMHGDARGGATVRAAKIDVRVAGDIAWFQANATLGATIEDDTSRTPVRFNGLAIKQSSWKIAAIAHSAVIPDKDLFAAHVKLAMPTQPPKLLGETAIARGAAGWIDKAGLAANAGDKPSQLVMGTAPSEYQVGAASGKLVAIWDKLGMRVIELDVKTLGGKQAGWVRARVALPVPKAKHAVSLVLTAVIVPDGAGWRWVSLHRANHLRP